MEPRVIHVVGLCAAWCSLCNEYAPLMDRVTSELLGDGIRLRRHWIDIEDEADLVGDFDVETFPTLVVIGPDGVRFAGPLHPHADNLRRVLRSTLVDAQPGARWPAAAPEVQAFAARLLARRQASP